MAAEQHSPIRFQLNESIWLDHQARHIEVTSLSLEPDVEVEGDSGLVTIRGSLVLTGKFNAKDEEDGFELDSSSLADQLHFQPLRVDQKEIYEKDYRNKIEKYFPVDVTVPQEKVEDLNRVYVHVEQFDYHIVDSHRLDIEADIAILGIEMEKEKDVVLEKKDGEFRADSHYPAFDVAATKDESSENEHENTPPPLQFSQQKAEEPAGEGQEARTGSSDHQDHQSMSDAQSDEGQEIRGASEVDKEVPPEPFYRHSPNSNDPETEYESCAQDRAEQSQTEQDQTGPETVEATQTPERQSVHQEGATADTVDQGDDDIDEAQESLDSRDDQDEHEGLNESEQLDASIVDREADTDGKVIPLFDGRVKTNFHATDSPDADTFETDQTESTTTDFLAQLMSGREEEGQAYTRLTMCITQKNESLEDIAERYELRVTDIMRVNRMSTQELREGQLLYIPKQ
ncbi:LysM peptidoglycan-binding domain-containing protein [Caldalkalibacillus salinus]|uniref:LysM peptidoglycan-binding domain-containing protein n=1 Tax=Caldalkalibacillus salinus TaxID=2803787 RepID=UPI001922E363|nr:LysM peptidoglycan-binding domain-containing protein [Caldalkalibacillus salinus]